MMAIDPPRPPFRFRIVVALDLSEYSEIVLEHAIEQAMQHEAPILDFMTVVDDAKVDLAAVKSQLAALVLPALEDCDATDWQANLHVCAGKPADEIASFAADERANLIVIGRFGLHHRGKRPGSVASRVIDAATCPTLVVGFTGDPVVPECAACVELRADSKGHAMFCPAHRDNGRVSLATTRLSSGSWTGGNLMW